ncbi:hypothetical protein [Thermoanaerobacterium sp. DL9XJH110]|uniref:hypothetical protein n=1 Tax=Thermoanaerobacterium sp. DL9XJH110 TaxID=3386643 RepID=UPI003BB57F8D
MSIPQEKIFELLKKLPDEDKKEALNFMEYLYEKRKKNLKEFLESVPEEDEELSPDEIEALRHAENDTSEPIEKVARELNFKWK